MAIEHQQPQPLNLKEILALVSQLDTDTSAALVIALLNQKNISMFGKSICANRSIFPDIGQRTIYNIHPYPKAGSGAHTIVFSKDECGELLVLLGMKKDRKQWIVPGGYFDPYPLEGVPGWQPDASGEGSSASSIQYDVNLQACAARELLEETGIQVSPENFTLLKEYSERNGNDPRLHSINIYYVVNLLDPCPIRPSSDLVETRWVPVSEISSLTLRQEHLQMILSAIDQQKQSTLAKLSFLKEPYCEYQVTENPLYGGEKISDPNRHEVSA